MIQDSKVFNADDVILFFDTETSGFFNKGMALDHPKQSWVVQIGAILSTRDRIISEFSAIVKSKGRYINKGAQDVHGISASLSDKYGFEEYSVYRMFNTLIEHTKGVVCHNYGFDINLVKALIARHVDISSAEAFAQLPKVCTMIESTAFCNLPYPSGRKGVKWPKLEELYFILFNEELVGAHDALIDVRATRRCYYELQKRGIL